MSDTKRHLSIGAAAIALASALRITVQVAVLPVIGRILGPDVYGQMALVAPFIFFSMILVESGLGACIVRAGHVTPALEGTVFCFSAVLSLVFIGLFALVAHPLGIYLQQPEVPGLLMGLSSILLLASFNIVPAALLLRARQYNWIAASDVASSLGSVAGVALGIYLGWGVWSLVAQQIAFWTFKVLVVSIGSRSYPRLIFQWAVLKQNMQFGSRLTATGIVSFLARNIDNVLIGRFMGTQALGFYALAFQIVSMPPMIVSGSAYYTLFAGTSEAARSGHSPKPQFLAVMRAIMLLCMPAIVGMAATANLSIPLIMGDPWTSSARLIVLLAPLGLCQTLAATMSGVLNGLGRAGTMLKAELVSGVATIIAIVATARLGSEAVAIGVSATALLLPWMALRVVMRECDIGGREILRAVASPSIAAMIMGLCVTLLQQILPASWPRFVDLIACIAAGGVLYLAALLVLLQGRVSENIADIRRLLGKRKAA